MDSWRLLQQKGLTIRQVTPLLFPIFTALGLAPLPREIFGASESLLQALALARGFSVKTPSWELDATLIAAVSCWLRLCQRGFSPLALLAPAFALQDVPISCAEVPVWAGAFASYVLGTATEVVVGELYSSSLITTLWIHVQAVLLLNRFEGILPRLFFAMLALPSPLLAATLAPLVFF